MFVVDLIKKAWNIVCDWFFGLCIVKYIIHSPLFAWLNIYKHICLGVSGAIIESSILSISAGSFCDSFYTFIIVVIVSSIFSIIFDLAIFFVIKFLLRKAKDIDLLSHNKKSNVFIKFINKFGDLSMILYRFIPFCRFPAIFLSLRSNVKKVVILNIIGSFASQLFFIGIGFFLKHV